MKASICNTKIPVLAKTLTTGGFTRAGT